ncbi:MAG: DNA helicase [Verrucomicrobiaceae bacterium]|nr:MAG: DNA helicase [Verrucomicrobiaceae bacterium]
MTIQRVISPTRPELAQLRTPLEPGELLTLELFDRSLEPEWEIYLQPHLNGCRPDFVLLHPRLGIAVFEVKDWNLVRPRYRWSADTAGPNKFLGTIDGKTFADRDPLAQLLGYKKEIFDLYCPRLNERSGLAAISAGLLFPNASQADVSGLFQHRLTTAYELALGKEAFDMGDVRAFIPAAGYTRSRLMTPELAADLRGWLVDTDHDAEQRRPLALDIRQRNLATTRTTSGYRRVRGPAGSGKSAVLVARAANLVAEKKRVLVVNFNITILNYLRDLCSRAGAGRRNNIVWLNFHALCKRLAGRWGIADQYNALWGDRSDPTGNGESENEELFDAPANLLLDYIAEHGVPEADLFDAVLVDEGQDYKLLWWRLLRQLCRPGGEMLLVKDDTQDTYGRSLNWTEQAMNGAGFSGDWSELPVTYRLPPALITLAADFATRYLPPATRLVPVKLAGELDVEPCLLRWLQVSQHGDASILACVQELLALAKKDGDGSAPMTDLTLLVDNIQSGEQIVEILNGKGMKTSATFEQVGARRHGSAPEDRRRKLAFWKGASTIKVSTLHSFKGWEARFIVLHITRARTARDFASVYAGLTRLKRHSRGSSLTVVCSEPSLAEYGATWPPLACIG